MRTRAVAKGSGIGGDGEQSQDTDRRPSRNLQSIILRSGEPIENELIDLLLPGIPVQGTFIRLLRSDLKHFTARLPAHILEVDRTNSWNAWTYSS